MIIQATYKAPLSSAGYVRDTDYWLYVELETEGSVAIRPVPAMLTAGEIPAAHSYRDLVELFKEWDNIRILSGSWHARSEVDESSSAE